VAVEEDMAMIGPWNWMIVSLNDRVAAVVVM
jgi:hypothetical protein